VKYSDNVKPNEEKILRQFDKLAHKVAHKTHRKMGNKYEYEDLYQVALLGIMQAIRTFDETKKVKFLTHAHNYAEFSISHYIRADTGQIKIPYTKIITKETAMPAYCELDDKNLQVPTNPTTFRAVEISSILKSYIEKLPERQRDIFQLTYQFGFTADEIAEKYGVTRQAVNLQAKNAAKSLQKMLETDKINYKTIME
jgi:RNA polymerase sigma factor (sigma-70 family)